MKDVRFIELLNLYVDHQITPGEAAELEAEILRDPARRETYQDYCRMQRACGVLFERGRQGAPASFALEKSLQETERKITAGASRRAAGWRPYATAFGGLAAMAACLAIAVIRPGATDTARYGGRDGGSLMTDGATQSPGLSAQLATLIPRAGTPAEAGLSGQSFMPVGAATLRGSSPGWMGELASAQRVLANDDAFKGQPSLEQNNRVFAAGHPLVEGTELTAFEFTR